MAVTLSIAAKKAAMAAIRDYFADGSVELLAANDTPLAIFALTADGGTVAGDTWILEFDGTTSGEAGAGAGTSAAKAQIRTGEGTAGLTGLTVGGQGSGADIELDNVNIAAGQKIALNSATLTHAA